MGKGAWWFYGVGLGELCPGEILPGSLRFVAGTPDYAGKRKPATPVRSKIGASGMTALEKRVGGGGNKVLGGAVYVDEGAWEARAQIRGDKRGEWL